MRFVEKLIIGFLIFLIFLSVIGFSLVVNNHQDRLDYCSENDMSFYGNVGGKYFCEYVDKDGFIKLEEFGKEEGE